MIFVLYGLVGRRADLCFTNTFFFIKNQENLVKWAKCSSVTAAFYPQIHQKQTANCRHHLLLSTFITHQSRHGGNSETGNFTRQNTFHFRMTYILSWWGSVGFTVVMGIIQFQSYCDLEAGDAQSRSEETRTWTSDPLLQNCQTDTWICVFQYITDMYNNMMWTNTFGGNHQRNTNTLKQ